MITAEALARMYHEAQNAARKLFCSEMVRHQFVREYFDHVKGDDPNQFAGMPVEVSPILQYNEWFIVDGHDRIIAASPGLNESKAIAITEASRFKISTYIETKP